MLSPETLDFAWQHRGDDTARLLLGKVPEGVDVRLAAQQIEGWHTARQKWPSLAANPLFLYPQRLNREQASSEATAAYKASLAGRIVGGQGGVSPVSVADLTGGMGVDTMALATLPVHVDYFELNPDLCDLMRRNVDTLGLNNIAVHNADSLAPAVPACTPSSVPGDSVAGKRYAFALIDPARRDAAGRRVAAFEDCSPDILAAMPRLQAMTQHLMIKASPMVDIAEAFKQLPPVSELHIVALRGECKELLFLIDTAAEAVEPTIHCVNLQGPSAPFVHRPSEAAAATAQIADTSVLPRYLYEPDATIMKAGCHALVASRFGLAMLSYNSHIYSSMQRVEGFPGRCFEVVAEVAPTRRALAPLLPDWRANVISRNHPLGADALRRQLRLADGGEYYLIATSVVRPSGLRPTAYLCLRVMG